MKNSVTLGTVHTHTHTSNSLIEKNKLIFIKIKYIQCMNLYHKNMLC